MGTQEMMQHIEALIFASERPLPFKELCELLGNIIEEPFTNEKVSLCLEAIQEKYGSQHYPFQIIETGGGYQFLTKKEYHQTVLQLNGDKYIKKLSVSAMETLSIIAYKQPVTKSDIEFIRGVSCDYSIQKLLEKELIAILGRDETAIGKPLLYGTSKHFMDYLGINSTLDLPRLQEVASPEGPVVPTDALDALPADLRP